MRRGVLWPIHRAVYALARSRLELEGRLHAALLAVPAAVAVSHRSAAALLGMLPDRRGPVHVTASAPTRGPAGVVVHRSSDIGSVTTVRRGIPCTKPPRTLVDVAADEGHAAAERAWSTLASRRLLRPDAVQREIERHPGRRGTRAVAALLARHSATLVGRTRSDLERAALRMCADHGLPRPQANLLLHVGDRVYEGDLVWRTEMVVAELDDWGTHGDPDSFRDDRRRDLGLTAAGYAPVRLLWEDVTDNAAATAAAIRRLLDRRAGG